MKTYRFNTLTDEEIEKLFLRPKIEFNTIFDTVQPILDEVKMNGDQAIRSYTQQFDGIDLDNVTIDPKTIGISLEPESVTMSTSIFLESK